MKVRIEQGESRSDHEWSVSINRFQLTFSSQTTHARSHSRLDRIQRCIRERTHRATNETQPYRLPTRQLTLPLSLSKPTSILHFLVLRLIFESQTFEFLIGGEVYSLIGSLTESGEGDASPESGGAFFFDDGVDCVRGTSANLRIKKQEEPTEKNMTCVQLAHAVLD